MRKRAALTRKYERYRSMVDEGQLRASLEEARQGTLVEVIDPALTPAKPSFPPGVVTVLALALALGIGAGVGCVLLGELADTSFRSVEDASDYLEVPVLGAIGTIEPAVSKVKTWLKGIVFVLLLLGLTAGVVASVVYQEELRTAFQVLKARLR